MCETKERGFEPLLVRNRFQFIAVSGSTFWSPIQSNHSPPPPPTHSPNKISPSGLQSCLFTWRRREVFPKVVVAESLSQHSTRTTKEGSGTSKRSKHTSSARFLTSFQISEEEITDAFLVTLVNPSATQRREDKCEAWVKKRLSLNKQQWRLKAGTWIVYLILLLWDGQVMSSCSQSKVKSP